jgi:hypothetical protein
MLVILPMHHRSPSAAGTVPTSMRGVLAELAEPALLGAVIAHPSSRHDAQLHVHGAPEAVSKVTASTAPAAVMGCVRCAACRTGTGECAPLTVGVAVGAKVGDRVGDGDGAATQAQSVSRRREGSPKVPLSYRLGPTALRGGGLLRGRRFPNRPPQQCPEEHSGVLPCTHSGGTRWGASTL